MIFMRLPLDTLMYLCPTCFRISAFEALECLRVNRKDGVVLAVLGWQQSYLRSLSQVILLFLCFKILQGKTTGHLGRYK